MTNHTLSTKTFGKAAKKEVVKLLPSAATFKRHAKMINLYDANKKHLGYVNEAMFPVKFALLRIF